MTETITSEKRAWAWLEDMVSATSDERPSDLAYSADQMVDAYMAGASAPPDLYEALDGLLAEFNAFVLQSGIDLSDMSADHIVNATWRKRQLAAKAAISRARGDSSHD